MMDALLICLAVASGVTMVVSLSWPALRKYRRLMRRSFRPRYRKTKALLDDVQRQIYQALQGMVGPGLHVFPSVRLCELLDLVGGRIVPEDAAVGVDVVGTQGIVEAPIARQGEREEVGVGLLETGGVEAGGDYGVRRAQGFVCSHLNSFPFLVIVQPGRSCHRILSGSGFRCAWRWRPPGLSKAATPPDPYGHPVSSRMEGPETDVLFRGASVTPFRRDRKARRPEGARAPGRRTALGRASRKTRSLFLPTCNSFRRKVTIFPASDVHG